VLRAIEALEVGQGTAIQEVLPQLAETMVSQIRRAPPFTQACHDNRLISIWARSSKTKSKSDVLLSKCRKTNQRLQLLQPLPGRPNKRLKRIRFSELQVLKTG